MEGRVAFVAAALFLAGALVTVIDRVGAPARLVTTLGPAIAMAGLVVLGSLVQATRISNFYAAGRVIPAKYVGLGMAGLAAALIVPMLPPGPPGGLHAAMLIGLVAGMALAGFASGPLLRKSGAYSLPGLFGLRFESPGLRSATSVVVAVASGFVALAGFDGAVRALGEGVGLAVLPAAALAGFIVLAILTPGGVAGSAWGAAIAAFAVSLALFLPLVILAATGSPLPAPGVGQADLWAEALTRMSLWSPPVRASASLSFASGAAVALGVAALAPLLSPMVACRNARGASRAGLVGLGWLLLLAAAMLVAMAISSLSLDSLAVGQRAESLPAFLYVASDKGLLTICGQYVSSPRAAALACAGAENYSGRLGLENIWASGRYLLVGLPELGRFSLAISALANAGYLAIALALTAAGVQAAATAIGHDLLFAAGQGPRSGPALASRRIAIARFVMIVLTATLAFFASSSRHAPQSLLLLSVLVSAAMVAPLLLLSTWSRTTSTDGALALGMGGCAVVVTIALAWNGASLQTPVIVTGAVAGFLAASLTGFATSLRRKESETRPGRIFVEGLLYGDGEMISADRGA